MSALDSALLELGGDLAGALEHVAVPAVLLDEGGTILWQNEASVAFRGNHVGSVWADHVAPWEQLTKRDVATLISRGGDASDVTIQVQTASGSYSPIQLSTVPLRKGGALVGVFGLCYPTARQPQARRPARGATLTNRQLDVLHLLADGASTGEIASELSLSPTTVRNHIANVLAVLGVHSRLQAVVAASNAGLLNR